MIGNSGTKKENMGVKAIADTPLMKRGTVRSLATAIGKRKSIVHE